MIVQFFLQKIVPDPRDCATHARARPAESLTPKGAVSFPRGEHLFWIHTQSFDTIVNPHHHDF